MAGAGATFRREGRPPQRAARLHHAASRTAGQGACCYVTDGCDVLQVKGCRLTQTASLCDLQSPASAAQRRRAAAPAPSRPPAPVSPAPTSWQAIKAQAHQGFQLMLREAGLPVGFSRPASFTAAGLHAAAAARAQLLGAPPAQQQGGWVPAGWGPPPAVHPQQLQPMHQGWHQGAADYAVPFVLQAPQPSPRVHRAPGRPPPAEHGNLYAWHGSWQCSAATEPGLSPAATHASCHASPLLRHPGAPPASRPASASLGWLPPSQVRADSPEPGDLAQLAQQGQQKQLSKQDSDLYASTGWQATAASPAAAAAVAASCEAALAGCLGLPAGVPLAASAASSLGAAARRSSAGVGGSAGGSLASSSHLEALVATAELGDLPRLGSESEACETEAQQAAAAASSSPPQTAAASGSTGLVQAAEAAAPSCPPQPAEVSGGTGPQQAAVAAGTPPLADPQGPADLPAADSMHDEHPSSSTCCSQVPLQAAGADAASATPTADSMHDEHPSSSMCCSQVPLRAAGADAASATPTPACAAQQAAATLLPTASPEQDPSAAAAAALARFEQLQQQLQQLQAGLPPAPAAPGVAGQWTGSSQASWQPGAATGGTGQPVAASPVQQVMHRAESFLTQASALLQRLLVAASSPPTLPAAQPAWQQPASPMAQPAWQQSAWAAVQPAWQQPAWAAVQPAWQQPAWQPPASQSAVPSEQPPAGQQPQQHLAQQPCTRRTTSEGHSFSAGLAVASPPHTAAAHGSAGQWWQHSRPTSSASAGPWQQAHAVAASPQPPNLSQCWQPVPYVLPHVQQRSPPRAPPLHHYNAQSPTWAPSMQSEASYAISAQGGSQRGTWQQQRQRQRLRPLGYAQRQQVVAAAPMAAPPAHVPCTKQEAGSYVQAARQAKVRG